MKTLNQYLEDYTKLRRQLGYRFLEECLLRNFVRFARDQGARFITAKLALRWATMPPNITQPTRAHRLGVVRGFAKYVGAIEPRSEVLPPKLLPYRFRRREPYHYTEEQVQQLMSAAQQIDPTHKIKGLTFSAFLGLLAATGMRVSEALALDHEDIDFSRAMLTIRRAKGNKTRLVPLHPSTVQALQRYAALRAKLYPRPNHPGFFVWQGGIRLGITRQTSGLLWRLAKPGCANRAAVAAVLGCMTYGITSRFAPC